MSVVSGLIKGGLSVDIGVRAFLPASRSGTKDSADLEKLVGQEISCKIIQLDVAEEDAVVDRRVVVEEEEKQALEVRKKDLQVAYKDGLFTLHVHKQFLTDVLEEMAAQARIGFNILTTNGAQKEIDQVVTWDIAAVSLEELTNTWFPSGIRLYWRADLANDSSKPLRLTIEPNQNAQAEQNVTP